TGAIARRVDSTISCGTVVATSRSTITAGLPALTTSGTNSWPSRLEPGTAMNRVPGPVWRLSWVASRTRTDPSPSTRPPQTWASRSSGLLVETIGCHPQTMECLLHHLGEHRRRRLAAGAVLPRRLVDHDRHHELGVVDRGDPNEAGSR